MAKATRVHSTPPTNTSLTRRGALGAIAAATAAVTVVGVRPTDAAPAIDPIYDAIERHKALTVLFDAAWDARGRFDDSGERDEKPSDELRRLDAAAEAAGLPMEEAACDLFNTVPTTPAGIVAAIRVIQTPTIAPATTADTCRAGNGCLKTRMIPETAAIGWNVFWTRSSNPSTRSTRRCGHELRDHSVFRPGAGSL